MAKVNSSDIKEHLHPRNIHRQRYDLNKLSLSYSQLSEYIYTNKYGDDTIDFSDPKAVLSLNKALLKTYYQIEPYDLPPKYLCPPIPGRADYIHQVADLLIASQHMDLNNLVDTNIVCLDIGTGANCIYPILGSRIYHWNFVATDIDQEAINIANNIIKSNDKIKTKIELRYQPDETSYFKEVVKKGEKFALSICNPPFHASAAEAQKATVRKQRNLKQKTIQKPRLNFGGTGKELWYPGGEKQFILNMIKESTMYQDTCSYFTTLVSKETTLPAIYKKLNQAKVKSQKTIHMAQGNKRSRIVAWSFTI